MTEIELTVQFENADSAQEFVVGFAKENGLIVASRGTLKLYPGSVHWHLRKPGKPGTLEATWWPKTRRFWWKVATNRRADWIEAVLGSDERVSEGSENP